MAVNIHITIIELNALHTKRQNLFQELDAVIHLLMEAKHWGLDRKSGSAGMPRSRMPSSAGKKIILKFEGCYHGHADSVLSQSGSGLATLGIAFSPGVP